MAVKVRSFAHGRWLLSIGVVLILAGIASWAGSLYRTRQTASESAAIAAALELQPTSRLADVGAGDGRFAVQLARALAPNGYVYATEIDLQQLAAIRAAAAEARLDNVTTLESRTSDTGLPPGCCDGVFLRTVYHHLTEPVSIAADLFSAVRPGGRLLIIDFPPRRWLSLLSPVNGVPDRGGHGIPAAVVIDELAGVGFTFHRRFNKWGGGNYGLIFIRPDN